LLARPRIVQDYAARLNLPEAFLNRYLLRNVNYDMGAAHIEGLERFYSMAFTKGLIQENRPIRFLSALELNTR
jgi:predicted solute-binding protein